MPAHIEPAKPEDKANPTPIIRATPLAPVSRETPFIQPKPEDYKGKFVQNDTGEVFGLAIVENDPLGKTHKCRNDVHFWEGSKSEFKAQFEKA